MYTATGVTLFSYLIFWGFTALIGYLGVKLGQWMTAKDKDYFENRYK